MTLATTSLSWIPALTRTEVAVVATACAALWVLLIAVQGRSLVKRRLELVLLRGLSMGLLTVILLGPTIVDEQPGKVTRPAMMMVVDASQSMQLGRDESRWDTALKFMEDTRESLSPENSRNCPSFRFGHQLRPLSEDDLTQMATASPATNSSTDTSEQEHPANATDSRLADALRQLLPQATAKSTSGVVLFSDGRVRASDTVEKLAEVFGDSNIPIHVVPTGESSGTGDVAVVSLVVPSSVRKFTENEMQVFLRSFGYSGQRTTVRVRRRSELQDDVERDLAEVPVTLRGGAQSVTLTFRVDEQPEELIVSVDPMTDELTERNNEVLTNIGINRSKVRVLYVEGQQETRATQFDFGGLSFLNEALPSRGSDIDLRSALQSDVDVECTMLLSSGGSEPYAVNAQSSNTPGFPGTRAELFAYDCVILSNVGPDVLTDQQTEWLQQWIEGRGGGLIVAGTDALQLSAWSDCALLPLLPVSLTDSKIEPAESIQVHVQEDARQHPIWRLQLEEQLNAGLLDELPTLMAGLRGHSVKSSADILAKASDNDVPVMMSHRAGRGRVMVSTASLTGRALQSLADDWGSQPERSASKLWRNIVYWATEGSSTGRRRLIASSDKRFYRPGENLRISATAYDEVAQQATGYRVWAMFEPLSLDDMSVYSPILWPENVVRESGEVGPRIAWGEELQLKRNTLAGVYELPLQLSETGTTRDSGFRIEMTAYEGEESAASYSHGTQVDSTSLTVQILNDPFEQQNPLPNRELLARVASLSGGSVLNSPADLAAIMKDRPRVQSEAVRDLTPAWNRWWLWLGLTASLTTEWCRRRLTGLA